METTEGASPASEYFRLEEVAAGVWAAIPTPAGGAAANAGFVDLGDRVLVVDTFRHPFAARDLRAAAERLTGHPVGYAINTHYHGERVLGNKVFADLPIIATERTRAAIAKDSGEFIEFARVEANRDLYVQTQERELAAETDETRRRWLEDRLAGTRVLAAAAADQELTLPNLIFDKLLVFHGPRRTAKLITFGGGHTDSDSFLYLPDDRIAFMSDLVFVQRHPALEDANPLEWIGILERVEQTLDIETVIGGHGPVGTAADILLMHQYLIEMIEQVSEVVAAGDVVEEAVGLPLSPAYAAWGGPPNIYERVTRALYKWVWDNRQAFLQSDAHPAPDL
jgi:glyoxylase-like metal-dependent hydrolase (beta-lactamase superfamily II)